VGEKAIEAVQKKKEKEPFFYGAAHKKCRLIAEGDAVTMRRPVRTALGLIVFCG